MKKMLSPIWRGPYDFVGPGVVGLTSANLEAKVAVVVGELLNVVFDVFITHSFQKICFTGSSGIFPIDYLLNVGIVLTSLFSVNGLDAAKIQIVEDVHKISVCVMGRIVRIEVFVHVAVGEPFCAHVIKMVRCLQLSPVSGNVCVIGLFNPVL